MAIINMNEVTLSDSGLKLTTTIVSSHTSEISNNNVYSVKVRAQIGFFLNEQKMLESPTNALKIERFEKQNSIMIFDYMVKIINGIPVLDLYDFDLKIKDHLMSCFPEWDENLLILTTQPQN